MNKLFELLEAERPIIPDSNADYDIGYNNGLVMAQAIALKHDFEPVVRCKDCKYWCEDTLSCTIGNHYDDNWYAEDFCSYGKKNANADPEGEIDFDYNAED